MTYRFKCNCCKYEDYVEIPINKYDDEKSNQFCRNCGNRMIRVLEWNGLANNLGGYSETAGKASWQS